ncbi:MAG: hypothetical protein JXR32_10790 [Anaerolineaceae bacterium]|nr:hypothetical protein [Anaerolineaceae bacterium]
MTLTDKQSENVMKVWNAYLEDGGKYIYPVTGFTHKEMDQQRVKVIPELKKLLDKCVYGSVTVEDFRVKVEEINKVNLLWGFQGANGQAFFNLIAKASQSANMQIELNNIFKETLPSPVTADFAVNNIRNFAKFTRSLLAATNDLLGALKVGSIPYFLSYFWQIQKPEKWPIYYKSMIDELQETGIWSPGEDAAQNYADYYELNCDMLDLIELKTEKQVTLWDIEHAFWNSAVQKVPQPAIQPAETEAEPEPVPIIKMPVIKPITKSGKSTRTATTPTVRIDRKALQKVISSSLSDSYIPPVVASLPALAVHDNQMATLLKESGKDIQKVFAERLGILFSMLGYEAKSPGQGNDHIPDGVAICKEYSYAIVYDARISQQPYTVQEDEPELHAYILKLGDRLRKQGYRTIYYIVVSCGFSAENDRVLRSLKIDMGVNEVILAGVDALMLLLEKKLRNPGLSLGPKGIQKLLAASGLLTKDTVRDLT